MNMCCSSLPAPLPALLPASGPTCHEGFPREQHLQLSSGLVLGRRQLQPHLLGPHLIDVAQRQAPRANLWKEEELGTGLALQQASPPSSSAMHRLGHSPAGPTG